MDHQGNSRVLNNSNNNSKVELLTNRLGSVLNLNNETSSNYSASGRQIPINQPPIVPRLSPHHPLYCGATNLYPENLLNNPATSYSPCNMNPDQVMMINYHRRMQLQQIMNNSYKNGTTFIQENINMEFAALISGKMMNGSEREAFMYLFQSRNNVDSAREILSALASYPAFLFKVARDREGSITMKAMIKLLRHSPEKISYLTRAFAMGIQVLMTDKIGAEVILYCFECIDYREIEVLSREVVKNCLELAKHPRGCIALNNIIFIMESQYVEDSLMIITHHTRTLASHPFGTFVLQRIVGSMFPEFAKKIVSYLQGYYVSLSMEKPGSYLVQKCLRTPGGQIHVVPELARSTDRLRDLACHEYGNFVIQTALEVTMSNKSLHRLLVISLRPSIEELRFHPRGKNIYRLLKESKKSTTEFQQFQRVGKKNQEWVS